MLLVNCCAMLCGLCVGMCVLCSCVSGGLMCVFVVSLFCEVVWFVVRIVFVWVAVFVCLFVVCVCSL